MKTIDIVIDTRKFLSEVCSLTTEKYLPINDPKLKPVRTKILKYIAELKSLNFVDEYEGKIKWKTIIPTIEMAYDFYCAINKKSSTFSMIKDIIQNPGNYSTTELMEAIAFNGFYENETGKSFIEKIEEDITVKQPVAPAPALVQEVTINSPEYKELNEKFLDLRKEYQNLNIENLMLKGRKDLSEKPENNPNEILKSIDAFVKSIGDHVFKIEINTDKIEGLQGSFRKVIGQLTSIQVNGIGQAKMLGAIIEHLLADFNGTNIHDSVANRKVKLEDALQVFVILKKYNDDITANYLKNNPNGNVNVKNGGNGK